MGDQNSGRYITAIAHVGSNELTCGYCPLCVGSDEWFADALN